MSFAVKVLYLPCLPQGSRSHHEKLIHEQHWTIGHNSCKEATSAPERMALLTCTLSISSDSCDEATFDNIFHPFFYIIVE